jgi:hypothetical protein
MKNSLQKKLWESGLFEQGDSSKIEDFKKTHRKDYLKKYNQEYREQTKRKSLNFTQDEFSFLEEEAEKYNYKQLAPFLKDILFAYLNESFINPDKNAIDEITHTLREINNAINESLKYVHLSQDVTLNDIQLIKQNISQIETSIERTLSSPPNLSKWIDKQQEKDADFISKLLKTLSNKI